jgi:hypothetical protein
VAVHRLDEPLERLLPCPVRRAHDDFREGVGGGQSELNIKKYQDKLLFYIFIFFDFIFKIFKSTETYTFS